MRIPLYLLSALFILSIAACNNESSEEGSATEPATSNRQTVADSLEKIVVDAHDIAMPKWRKIPEIKKAAQRALDSLAKLPASAKSAAKPYIDGLTSLVRDLDSANLKMESWMDAYGQKIMALNADTALAKLEEKISYLNSQQEEVNGVKQAVLKTISRADSLLKTHF